MVGSSVGYLLEKSARYIYIYICEGVCQPWHRVLDAVVAEQSISNFLY